MAVRQAVIADEITYFVQRSGAGVARVLLSDRKLISLYRNAKDWREVSRETYLRARFRLCLV